MCQKRAGPSQPPLPPQATRRRVTNSAPKKQKQENDKGQSKSKCNGTHKNKNVYIMKQKYDFLKRKSKQLITLYPEISGAKEHTPSVRTTRFGTESMDVRRIIRDQSLSSATQMTWESVLKDVNYPR